MNLFLKCRAVRSVPVLCITILTASGAVPVRGSGESIPGFVRSGGRWVPDEPYKEGQVRATGLQIPFPEMKSLDRNPVTPEKVHLGKLLFFDPVVSGDNTISCATCHHPDFGFGDGRQLSMGVGGKGIGPDREGGAVLGRHAPTLWNAAYLSTQFWDGRAEDLEMQAAGPIQDHNEMNQDADELVRELKAIPEYVDLFATAFDQAEGDPLTFDNVTRAIATFERTLLSFNSKFDRYAAGDVSAMNAQERRGLQLFRSLKTRCFECHTLPAFTDSSFRLIGVPDLEGQEHDIGRARVPNQGPDGAFKVPTMRNAALTAPYMHNGIHATLEDMIDFYAKGGGHQFTPPVPNVDDKIGTFDITPEETADLVAFIHALTDTSLQPDPPAKVPSGLPVVEVKSRAVPQPPMRLLGSGGGAPPPVAAASAPLPTRPFFGGREVAAAAPTAEFFAAPSVNLSAAAPDFGASLRRARESASGVTATFQVHPGQSIQAAVDRAMPGDVIEVYPGVYNQNVVVDRSGISLIGMEVNGERPVLDGMNQLPDALQGTGSDFLLQGFTIRNYTGNGAMINKARNVKFRDLIVDNPGLYAVYPVECVGVLVEDCVVSGAKDAGIYVGQSREIIVRNNEVFNNVAGIEIENSSYALVSNNSAHHNTTGILVFVLPNNPSKVGEHCRVVNNRCWENNHENFAKVGTIVSFLPPGNGILIMAADHTEVTGNVITGNDTFGVVVMSFLTSSTAPKKKIELDIEPNSDNTLVHGNIYADNGRNPAKRYAARGVPGGDLFWDSSGVGNGWRERADLRRFPEELPEASGLQSVNYTEMLAYMR